MQSCNHDTGVEDSVGEQISQGARVFVQGCILASCTPLHVADFRKSGAVSSAICSDINHKVPDWDLEFTIPEDFD
jgi:hypothetical protein